MLAELCDHIMDIAINSIRAGARNISVSIAMQPERRTLSVTIGDDGIGMEEEALKRITDPFYSTKEGKEVGLGVSLLKGATEICEGEFRIKSALGEGTQVEAVFPADHPDVPPVGNVKDTFLLLCVTNPEVHFFFRSNLDDKDFELDTKQVTDILGDVPINHPEVVTFLASYMEQQL
jgi:hypothetical protein